MKSNLMAVISIAYLVVFFHPCHGIICYMCQSSNYGNSKCDKISGDDYVLDYGDKEEYCVKIVLNKKHAPNVKEDRLLIRGGLSDAGYNRLNNVLEDHGFEVNYFKCYKDKCNSD